MKRIATTEIAPVNNRHYQIMKNNIVSLVSSMQKMIEHQNGTLTGGFRAISWSTDPGDPSESSNAGNCRNGYGRDGVITGGSCANSTNSAVCRNISCAGSVNGGYDGYSCANSSNCMVINDTKDDGKLNPNNQRF